MKKSFAVMIQEGGTGKTTTALALAAGLARRGQRTLLIDVDQQGDATRISSLEPEIIGYTTPDVFKGTCSPKDAIYTTQNGYDLLPTFNNELRGIEYNSKVTIAKIVSSVQNDYDYAIIDCPPHIGAMSMQALRAVDEIIIPVHADEKSAHALLAIIGTALAFKKEQKNRKLSFAGILVNEYSDYSTEKRSVMNIVEIARKNNIKVFDTLIPRAVVVREAWEEHKPIFNYINRNSKNFNSAVLAYDAFVTELTGLKEVDKDAKDNKEKDNKEEIRIVSRTSCKQPNVSGTCGSKVRSGKVGAARKKTRKARI